MTPLFLAIMLLAITPPLKQHFEYVLHSTCNGAEVHIAKGPDFKCVGPDKGHLVCTGIDITVKGVVDSCLDIHVIKDLAAPKLEEK